MPLESVDYVGSVDNQVVDATTAKTFTAPAGAKGFFISVATADIWVNWAATAAASTGLRVVAGQPPTYIPIGKTFTAFGAAASCPTSVLWVA